MIKYLAAALCILLSSAAAQAQTVTVWQGNAQLVSVTAACLPNNFQKGQYYTSVYRPANIDDNGPNTRLTFVGSRSMQRLVVTTENANNGGTYDGQFMSSRAGFGSWSGTFENTIVSPANLTNTAHVVIITGKINDFGNTPGCTVIFRGTYSRRLK